MERKRKTLDEPSAAFATPYIGSVDAAESVGDEHIPLDLHWRSTSSLSPRLWLMIDGQPGTRVELAFDPGTRRLAKATLVLASPDAWSHAAFPDSPAVPTFGGLPRCDPAAWTGRTRTGTLGDHGDHYLWASAIVRIAIAPPDAVLYLDGLAGEVAAELSSGRARIGVDARGAIGYVRLTGLTARETALLEEHRGQPDTVIEADPPLG